ncbi:hypothetical protein C4580_01315 [Candidatus Woesearchaeota archaeon]|nr:MAG: hypothetical protein C4580_01315 [Candidatus Woesearchaeota archaeon]
MSLEALAEMEYPGRFIILGRDKRNECNVAIYGLTGRSPASQARKIVYNAVKKEVQVEPTEPDVLRTGDPALLIYPAMMMGYEFAVSNGAQTKSVANQLHAPSAPVHVLMLAHSQWSFEPDAPHYTPRISGCFVREEGGLIVHKRAENGSAVKHIFEVPMIPGRGSLIATYDGANRNPLPSFSGEPRLVSIEGNSAEDMAEQVYATIAPKDGCPDFRVAVAAAYVNTRRGGKDVGIVNRQEGGK